MAAEQTRNQNATASLYKKVEFIRTYLEQILLFTGRFLRPLTITPTHFALRRSGFHIHRAIPPLCQIPLGDMLGLRRSITYLWTLAPRGGGDGNGDDMRLQTPRSVDEGACHPQLAGSSRAVMKRGRDQEEEGNSSTSGMRHDEPQPPAIREVTLSYPWGGHDSRPPRGWSTAAHEDPNRTKSPLLQRGVSSPQFHFSASAGNNDWDSCLPSPIKRPRDHAQEENLRSRRRRPSKTNGTYVSPSQPPLPEMDAEAELQLLRSWPPPRLTFRADLIRRAVSGRGTAVRRPMSRSRRRELDDALVRRAYDATHPSASEGKEDREGQQDSRALEDARRGLCMLQN